MNEERPKWDGPPPVGGTPIHDKIISSFQRLLSFLYHIGSTSESRQSSTVVKNGMDSSTGLEGLFTESDTAKKPQFMKNAEN